MGFILTALIALILSTGIPTATAQSVVTPTPAWYLGNFVEDIEVNIGFEFDCFCSKSKAEIETDHAIRQQRLIDELDKNKLPIPLEFEQRRAEKIQHAEVTLASVTTKAMNDDKKSSISDAIDRLKVIGELNEIRILYSQLPEVRNSNDATKQHFNARVNSLESWKEHCNGTFDVNDFDKNLDSWEAIKKRCGKLATWERDFGFDAIRDVIIR